jgi:hypothetical protein
VFVTICPVKFKGRNGQKLQDILLYSGQTNDAQIYVCGWIVQIDTVSVVLINSYINVVSGKEDRMDGFFLGKYSYILLKLLVSHGRFEVWFPTACFVILKFVGNVYCKIRNYRRTVNWNMKCVCCELHYTLNRNNKENVSGFHLLWPTLCPCRRAAHTRSF